ncbi:MAG: rhodanese-like domain-containing protein [Acidobacteriota bacterium]|nr:rhodanese-like domain-containing protein [Acidobacteriota bacterium]
MRFILSFVMFAVFGFAQQNCHKATTTTTSNSETAKSSSNTTAKNNSNAATAAAPTAAFPEEAPRITLEDAKKAFDEGSALFVDTRAEVSYKTEHIKGAINIPADDFQTRYKELPKNKKIIAYCS